MSESSVPVPRPSETPLPTTTQEECDAKVAAAHTEISALCHGKRWLMSIPVRPEADSDTIICDALRALKDRVKILEAELARASSEEAANSDTPQKLHGVVWALIGDSDGRVVLERCEKKARVLGVGEWFLPGGKIEGDETPEECLRREIGEEWPGVELLTARPLPIVEGSSVPPGPRGLFLMRPFVITVRGEVPSHSSEGTPLRWASVAEALFSPVPQVRMIVAAARVQGENA